MNNMKTVLKIFAGLAGAALIGCILFVANSFVGNPVSAMMADSAIKKYVSENYSYLDLELGKTEYDFKDGAYSARAESRASIDTKFNIYYKGGRVSRDDYETYVLGMFNTVERLSEEYSAIARDIIANELGYENNTTMVMYDKDVYGKANDVLKLDMVFDRSLPVDAEVMIRLDLKDSSPEGIAKVLTGAHEAFKDDGCNFSKYSLYAENNGMMVMVNGVTPENIESGELTRLLENAKNKENSGGISVFIKGEKM